MNSINITKLQDDFPHFGLTYSATDKSNTKIDRAAQSERVCTDELDYSLRCKDEFRQVHVLTKEFYQSYLPLGSVAGPVIQANGRLIFENDLRSEGLLCYISMNASVRTELADSMVTPGEPGGD